MKQQLKLNLSFILENLPSITLIHKLPITKNSFVLIPNNYLYYIVLHIKFSTFWYSTQLVELFAYETPTTVSLAQRTDATLSKVVCYNFHNLFSHYRFFLFTWINPASSTQLKSIAEVFANANWLERELLEMSGINFEWKQDMRNLLLTYGDSTVPLRKSTPSIGTKETFYDVNNDTLIHTPLTTQI